MVSTRPSHPLSPPQEPIAAAVPPSTTPSDSRRSLFLPTALLRLHRASLGLCLHRGPSSRGYLQGSCEGNERVSGSSGNDSVFSFGERARRLLAVNSITRSAMGMDFEIVWLIYISKALIFSLAYPFKIKKCRTYSHYVKFYGSV